jgi:hypothetical protein
MKVFPYVYPVRFGYKNGGALKHSGNQKLNQAATATANGINFIVNLAWAAIGVGVLIAAANGIGGAVSWILGVGLIIYAGSKLLTFLF